jgi:hypothetical protein
MPYIGRSTDGFGVRNRFIYLATSGATSVSGADANGATLTFTDGAYVDVYLNGVLLKPTTDYNTSTAGTIAGLSALNTSDEVTVVVYDVFTVGDMVSATSGGTFVGNVTHSGTVTFGSTVSGLDVNGTEVILDADADTSITADTDDQIDIKIGGTDEVTLSSSGIVINEGGNDRDFRIESDGEANMFLVDGGNNSVILGHSAEITPVGSPEPRLQAMAGAKQPSVDLFCFSDTTGHSGHLTFNKANSDTVGTMTAITDAHIVGRITAGGSDGTNFDEMAAIFFQADEGIGNNDTPGAMVFYTTPNGDNSGTERMRISNDGQVRFVNGQVVMGGTSVLNSSELSITSPGSNNRVATFNCGGTGSTDQILFQNGNGEVGTIRTSGSGTAYNTTSDYRLKENETSLNDGITRLKQLKPYYFNFKTEPNTKQEGFLAHEVQSVVPIAVSGDKDATKEITYEKVAEELYDDPTDTEKYRTIKTKQVMDTKTVIDPQQLDHSKLVPLLTAALQEAITKIETLEAKVKTLEEA